MILGSAIVALLALDHVNPPPRPSDPGIARIDTTSHARLITLRSARYHTRHISRFLPIADEGNGVEALVGRPTRAPSDVLLSAVVLLWLAAVAAWSLSRIDGDPLPRLVTMGIVACFALELVAQRMMPNAALFPLLFVILGVTLPRAPAAERVVVTVTGLGFLGLAMTRGGPAGGAPVGGSAIALLYGLGIASKLLLFAAAGGRPHLRRALVWTAALTLLELRVFDHPLTALTAIGITLIARRRAPLGPPRRMALMAFIQALIYFTLRLPIYQLLWIDLFLAALWLVSRHRDDAWSDALLIAGSFTLTSAWVPSGLEWGFLYTLVPAHLVELQVQYFLPLILAKIPLVLWLATVVVGRAPDRRFVTVLAALVACRFAAAFGLRLVGAAPVETWPLAEQAAYLSVFFLAALLLAVPARPASSASSASLGTLLR